MGEGQSAGEESRELGIAEPSLRARGDKDAAGRSHTGRMAEKLIGCRVVSFAGDRQHKGYAQLTATYYEPQRSPKSC
jgi:hypothetical protein